MLEADDLAAIERVADRLAGGHSETAAEVLATMMCRDMFDPAALGEPPMMTAGELIAWLQTVEPSRVVVLAKDAEGNDYTTLAGVTLGRYRVDPDTPWSVEPLVDDLTGDYLEADVDGYTPAVILTPAW